MKYILKILSLNMREMVFVIKNCFFVEGKTLLSSDWKIACSNPQNNLLCKKYGKVAYNTPIDEKSFPSDSTYAGALVHRTAMLIEQNYISFIKVKTIQSWCSW